jgi:hypothetical protein
MLIAENGSKERENDEILEWAPAIVVRLAHWEHAPSVAIIGFTDEASVDAEQRLAGRSFIGSRGTRVGYTLISVARFK